MGRQAGTHSVLVNVRDVVTPVIETLQRRDHLRTLETHVGEFGHALLAETRELGVARSSVLARLLPRGLRVRLRPVSCRRIEAVAGGQEVLGDWGQLMSRNSEAHPRRPEGR